MVLHVTVRQITKRSFHQLSIRVPTTMLISENDPWLGFEDAKQLARCWKLYPVNMGAVGHINVASGFGPFPEIFNYLISENHYETYQLLLMKTSIYLNLLFKYC